MRERCFPTALVIACASAVAQAPESLRFSRISRHSGVHGFSACWLEKVNPCGRQGRGVLHQSCFTSVHSTSLPGTPPRHLGKNGGPLPRTDQAVRFYIWCWTVELARPSASRSPASLSQSLPQISQSLSLAGSVWAGAPASEGSCMLFGAGRPSSNRMANRC